MDDEEGVETLFAKIMQGNDEVARRKSSTSHKMCGDASK